MSDKLKQLWEFVELVKRMRALEKRSLQHPNDYTLRNEARDYRRRVDHALADLAGKPPTLFPESDGAT